MDKETRIDSDISSAPDNGTLRDEKGGALSPVEHADDAFDRRRSTAVNVVVNPLQVSPSKTLVY
jgi:hypothetical protein